MKRLRAPTLRDLAWEEAGIVIAKAQYTAELFESNQIFVIRDAQGLPLACYILPKKPE